MRWASPSAPPRCRARRFVHALRFWAIFFFFLKKKGKLFVKREENLISIFFEQWVAMGLLVPAPPYSSGEYISTSCLPTPGECIMFKELLERKVSEVNKIVFPKQLAECSVGERNGLSLRAKTERHWSAHNIHNFTFSLFSFQRAGLSEIACRWLETEANEGWRQTKRKSTGSEADWRAPQGSTLQTWISTTLSNTTCSMDSQ